MPASKDYTLIKLMRGNLGASEAWTPEEGEPLLDFDTGTLRYGDGKTLGGTPINTVTAIEIETPADLNQQKMWGRYFLNGPVSNVPTGVEETGRYFLTVQSSDLGAPEVWQTLQVLDGKFASKTYIRVTLNSGIKWSDWKDTTTTSFSSDGSGSGANPGETNVNKYIYSSQAFVEGITSGPTNTNGGSGFLITYRKDANSKYIFQQLIMATPNTQAGRVYYRFSVNSNDNWNAPGYNWREWTDYANKDLGNVTGVLAVDHGGTGANTTDKAITSLFGANPIPVSKGGTGASNASGARDNLGLKLPLPVASGGTGANAAEQARLNLGIKFPLPVEHGGTGATTGDAAITKIFGSLPIPISKGGTGATTTNNAIVNIFGSSPIPISKGGTGANAAAAARENLGITFPLPVEHGGTGSTSKDAAITSIFGSLPIPVSKGGTGATTADNALKSIAGGLPIPVSKGGTGATTADNALKSIAGGLPIPTSKGGTGRTDGTVSQADVALKTYFNNQ